MRLTNLFTKTLREAPGGEVAKNAQLLTRGGFIFKNMAGVYSLLPLGVRVMKKIEQVVREEIDAIGGQELHLNILQDRELWKKTKRWDEAKEVMYRFSSRVLKIEADGPDVGLGFTHEEVVAQIAKLYIHSYKDLPKFVYQIQTKFRNEVRAQAGLIRTREFDMKDLYSLTRTPEELDQFYERCAGAYAKIFKRLELETIRTKASGGLFSEYSDEFQVLSEVGEDAIYVCREGHEAINKEIIDRLGNKCSKCNNELIEKRAIEVGNIFKLGTRFSQPLGLFFTDEDGSRKPVIMGSYGIGTGRAMATVVEVHHDGSGIIWPPGIAPFTVYLIGIGKNARPIYDRLIKEGIEVLYDDREGVSPGQQFTDADLIGCPYRVVISEKTGEKLEIKRRGDATPKLIGLAKVIDILGKI